MQAFFHFIAWQGLCLGVGRDWTPSPVLRLLASFPTQKKCFPNFQPIRKNDPLAVHTLPMVDGLMVWSGINLTAPMMTTCPPYKSGLLLVRLRATGNQSFFESSLFVGSKFNPSSAPNLNLVLWNEKNKSFVSVMFVCRRHHPASHLLHRFTLFWCSGLLTLSVQLLWILKATGWRWTLTSWSDIYQRTIWNLWFWALVRNLQWMCRTDCAWNYFFVGGKWKVFTWGGTTDLRNSDLGSVVTRAMGTQKLSKGPSQWSASLKAKECPSPRSHPGRRWCRLALQISATFFLTT